MMLVVCCREIVEVVGTCVCFVRSQYRKQLHVILGNMLCDVT